QPAWIVDTNNEPIKAYLAMPFFKDQSLGNFIENYDYSQSIIPLYKIILNLLYQVKNCHDKSIIHRDIKPSNIMIDSANLSITLIDYGISSLPYDIEVEYLNQYLPPDTAQLFMSHKNKSSNFSIDISDTGCTIASIVSLAKRKSLHVNDNST